MSSTIENISFPLLIDGGLSNQLESQGCDLNHPLWTARLIQDDQKEVIKAHLAYLDAGAKCIATMSYQASRMGYEQIGITHKEADALILKSVDLAAEAGKLFMSKNPHAARPLIAASLGPYGAALSDGSEYRGDYQVEKTVLAEFHSSRIDLLANSSADLLAFETIPSLEEAQVLSELLKQTSKPYWVSFSCIDETCISDGTNIKKVVDLFESSKSIFAIGVNCTAPKYISGLITQIKRAGWPKHIIVYPNLGEVFNAEAKTWENTEQEQLLNAEIVEDWFDRGADIIGGCCQVGPDDISKINHLFP
jgi:homocysteine S-methyltransferase